MPEPPEVMAFISDIEALLATLSELFALQGTGGEVAMLAYAEVMVRPSDEADKYLMVLAIPVDLFVEARESIATFETIITEKLALLLKVYPGKPTVSVLIVPKIQAANDWRVKAIAWLNDEGITNQGRVRSDNIAAEQYEGLLFRSQAEIQLYKALKAKAVPVAPLPVFIRGGIEYQRIEVDFVVIKDGVLLVIEVDGDTIHRETPAAATKRLAMLRNEGVVIERLLASECSTPDLAAKCAENIMHLLEKLKANK